jgi:hypothetical protein
MKANLNYFYKFHHKNIKKLSFFSKSDNLSVQKHNIAPRKNQNVKNALNIVEKINIIK